MCTTCGCGGHGATIDGRAAFRRADPHAVAIGAVRTHAPAHEHHGGMPLPPMHDGAVAHAHGRDGADDASASRILQVERDLLAKNDAIAALNRRVLAERQAFALNLVSSPGSGKTTLLVRTIEAWGDRSPVAVVEGDQQTSFDADRIRATGAPAVQVNTGKGCHLDAAMVSRALARLDVAPRSLLFIENVGNLVCPAAFDLGEAHKIVILSVTEGEDKPLKYPDMFRAADLMLLNKIDLAPYVSFDRARAIEMARRVRPGLEVIELSATTGEGMDRWLAWLEAGLRGSVAPAAAAAAGTHAA